MTDRALYVAMTGASASLKTQASVSHNLANADTVGFQATLSGTTAAPVEGAGHASRVTARHSTSAGTAPVSAFARSTGTELTHTT